jgi:hypothetical protein
VGGIKAGGSTPKRTRALKAQQLAEQFAADLARFHTPVGILTDDCAGETDDVLCAIEQIAATHFDGDLDFTLAFDERFSAEVPRLDKRFDELYSLFIDECHAQQLAGFALGVAWGRMQSSAAPRKGEVDRVG